MSFRSDVDSSKTEDSVKVSVPGCHEILKSVKASYEEMFKSSESHANTGNE